MGEAPDWYGLLKAAKYLGVAPWDLVERSIFWKDIALVAQAAEAQSEKQKKEAQQRRGKKK